MEDIMEIIKFPKDFDLLIKVVCKTIENEAKEQKKWNSWHVISHFMSKFIRNIIEK